MPLPIVKFPTSPNACVIRDEKPCFHRRNRNAYRLSVNNTVKLLTLELQIRLDELDELWHYASLEKIFIENELYEPIKECKTEEAILETIDAGLDTFQKLAATGCEPG